LISLSFKLLPHWIIDNVSSFYIALTCYHLHDHRQSFPQWNYFASPVELDPFPRWIRVPFYCFLFPKRVTCVIPLWTSLFSPVIKVCLLWFHFQQDSKSRIRICIISILGILGPKLGILYLSPFIPSRQRFHLHLFRWRNLNRGICHTPIFDLRSRLIYICHIFLSGIFYAILNKISAERYFKMPHFVNFSPSCPFCPNLVLVLFFIILSSYLLLLLLYYY
jgi:hypothetical protein